MLHLSRRVTLGVDVGNFLQLECAFERDRIVATATQEQEVPRLRVLARDRFNIRLVREDSFDLVIVTITEKYEKALQYTDRLAMNNPSLPVLLLTDYGVFVPVETLSASIESGNPADLLQRENCRGESTSLSTVAGGAPAL